MAAALRVASLVCFACCARVIAAEAPIPFVGPPAPPPPLVIKKFAGDVFNLDLFELHIPLDDDGDGIADVVTMPLLRNFEDPAFFRLDKTGEAILFRTQRGDATLEGSDASRSELWERAKGAESVASWGSNDGLVHHLSATFAFTRIPEDGTPVVALGIFGKEGEILAIRHIGEQAILSRKGLDPLVLDPSYVPGKPLDLMILLDKGRARAFRGTAQFAEWPLERDGLHIRAGCVLEGRESGGADKANAEVAIWKLYLSHKGS